MRGWGAGLAGFGAEVGTAQVPVLSLLPIFYAPVTPVMGMATRDEPQLEGSVLGRGSHPQPPCCSGEAAPHQFHPSDAGTHSWVTLFCTSPRRASRSPQ